MAIALLLVLVLIIPAALGFWRMHGRDCSQRNVLLSVKLAHRLYLASACLPMFCTVVLPMGMTVASDWNFRKKAIFTKLAGVIAIALTFVGVTLTAQANLQSATVFHRFSRFGCATDRVVIDRRSCGGSCEE